MNIKLLTEHHLKFLSLKGGCTGSSESTLVKMPHCWKSHVTAHLLLDFSITVKAATLIFISGHLLSNGTQVLFIIWKELISSLGCANVRAFRENPNGNTLNSHL